MRLQWFRKRYDPITTKLEITHVWLATSNKLDKLQQRIEDGSYSGGDLHRILGSYSQTKRKLTRLGATEETAVYVNQLIAILEMHEKSLNERLPESFSRGNLKQYTSEEVAQVNRRIEWYMDQWRKTKAPDVYEESTVDMRTIELPVREMVVAGGSYLPESRQQGALMLEKLLTDGRKHTTRLDYNLN